MSTKLTIRWDGDAPGLQQHALSLSAWLEPLGTLLRALRRAASNLDASRPDDPERGKRGGRHTLAAAAIDLQITAIRQGCVVLDLEATQKSAGQQPFSPDLPARALVAVVRDIKGEAEGRDRSVLARRFLDQLPCGVRVQEYTVEHEGVPLISEKISESAARALPAHLPRLERVVGSIVGVGFEPGRSTITFKTRRQRLTRGASEQLVERALALRGRAVEAMCLVGPTTRVLWLRPAGEENVVTPDDERSSILRNRWARTLAILGE